MLTILFDGIAYGMLLFVLACGLAVTLGWRLLTAVLSNRAGVPFLSCSLPAVTAGSPDCASNLRVER